MPQATTIDRVAPIAEEQWGLITRAEAGTERRVRGYAETAGGEIGTRAGRPRRHRGLVRRCRTTRICELHGCNLNRRCLLGSGHGTKGSFPIGPRRRCTGWVISQRTATSSRCRAGGKRAGPTCGCTRASQGFGRRSVACRSLAFRDRRSYGGPGGPGRCGADHCRRNPGAYDYPGNFAETLAPHAAAFGLRRGDGFALLRGPAQLVGDPETSKWLEEAQAHLKRQRKAFAGSPPEDTE